MDNEKINLISFTTDDHVYHKRSNDFYWTIGLITLVFAILAFIFHNALFGVLILIGVFMYGYVSVKKPKQIFVNITNKDITIDDNIYSLVKIESFNILEMGEEKDLVLKINRLYQPMVSVCIPDGLATTVKEAMLTLIKEDKDLVPHIGRRFTAKYKL